MEYTYLDARDGTKYCAHTDTSKLPSESMASLRYTIMEGGDQTVCKKTVLGTPVMGSGRG